MNRVAAGLILLSMVLLIITMLETTGTTAIWFSFVGTPALGLGVLLGLFSQRRGGDGT